MCFFSFVNISIYLCGISLISKPESFFWYNDQLTMAKIKQGLCTFPGFKIIYTKIVLWERVF